MTFQLRCDMQARRLVTGQLSNVVSVEEFYGFKVSTVWCHDTILTTVFCLAFYSSRQVTE